MFIKNTSGTTRQVPSLYVEVPPDGVAEVPDESVVPEGFEGITADAAASWFAEHPEDAPAEPVDAPADEPAAPAAPAKKGQSQPDAEPASE